ncbi:DUF6522 family protein [Arenimonas metalli]|uniref:Uncharacterized protein n=1 Tax=Arenimonas metalli CF5-1 TaxID=1384056 RepID=A0A091ASB3_9GAMM|nr:DUF6522 family protein [Arenimonas metalli]KFN41879.1 hypothetical protein N787_03705 [Arenimonas metalli CF5-1]
MDIVWNDFGSHQLSGVAEALDAAGIGTSAAEGPGATAADAAARASVEVDAALVASGLGLAPAQVPAMLADRRIATLCERGTGEDAGRYRFTFYLGNRRFRLLTDASGRPLPG